MTLKKLLLKNKKDAFLYILGIIISGSTNVLFTLALANIFNALNANSTQELIKIVIVSFIIAIIPVIAQIISRFLRIGFMTQIIKDVRLLAYNKILNLSNEKYNEQENEAYQSLLISDVNLFERNFFLSILNIGFSLLNSLISLTIVFFISYEFALIALLTMALLTIITKLFEKPVRLQKQKTIEQNAIYNESVANLVAGAPTIKHYSKESNFLNSFKNDTEKLESIKGKSFLLQRTQRGISNIVAYASSTILILLATYFLGIGKISIAELVILINVSGSLSWTLIHGFVHINNLISSVDIFNRIVASEDEIKGSVESIDSIEYSVKNLSFSYDNEVNILDDLSFNIKPNEKVLIHGPSGTGKTTLLNNLSQNLRNYTGSIKLGSHELIDISQDTFLDYSSYIRQSHFMFNDTVKNNIVLNQKYDHDKYMDVLKKASIIDWLEANEEITLESNGSNISGGQKQRISFARELYSDSDIIFIDEPSASLDDANAEVIYDTIINLDKTVVCVSHRHLNYLRKHFDHVIAFNEEGAVTYEKA